MFAAVVARDADAATADFVRAVAAQVPPQPAQFLQDGLRQAGVRLDGGVDSSKGAGGAPGAVTPL